MRFRKRPGVANVNVAAGGTCFFNQFLNCGESTLLVAKACGFVDQICSGTMMEVRQVVGPSPFGGDKEVPGLHVACDACCHGPVIANAKVSWPNGRDEICCRNDENAATNDTQEISLLHSWRKTADEEPGKKNVRHQEPLMRSGIPPCNKGKKGEVRHEKLQAAAARSEDTQHYEHCERQQCKIHGDPAH